MSTFTSTIKQIESEFDDVYRITAENGLVLDIPENNKPVIGSKIKYSIDTKEDSHEYTIMNGIVFNTNNTGVYVSFGGLLGNIPLDDKMKKNIKNNLCLSYKLIIE